MEDQYRNYRRERQRRQQHKCRPETAGTLHEPARYHGGNQAGGREECIHNTQGGPGSLMRHVHVDHIECRIDAHAQTHRQGNEYQRDGQVLGKYHGQHAEPRQ
jgi:hypothetical protein